MTAPRATMRLQLHRDFTFADAMQLVPYLTELGTSHLYVSPILTARAGSMHGYDVIDPTRVNPELGGEDGLRELVATLRQASLGLIVDLVPNHMAAGGTENPWWGDVLQHGQSSRYASFFDIDWSSEDPTLRGKVLAPFLGDPYGDALQSGTLTLERDGPEPFIRYYDTQFPLRPEDHREIRSAAGDAFDTRTEAGRARLHRLLERQHYRLAWWRTAGDAINWRRFFDINGLAGLRIEDETVFEATHATFLRLYREGLVDGVRIDHVDGLADPPAYCRRLRSRLADLEQYRPDDAPKGPAWFVVEKILGAGEQLPGDWQVDGTSGYDFMDAANALLHDEAGRPGLQALWGSLSGRPTDFIVEETAARRDILDRSFSAQLDAVTTSLHRLASRQVATRDITFASIRRALIALLAHFPVYRTYGCEQLSRADAAVFARALAGAMSDCHPADRMALGMIDRLAGGEPFSNDPDRHRACVQFQQLSAPLAAKAVEDTAYYRYGVLLSRNEVGADIARFSLSGEAFHASMRERRERQPNAMLATATHDHKRGEDVRARLAVLSEVPDEWDIAVHRWLELNAPHRRLADRPMPSPGDEAMLYQMIVAAWPVTLDSSNAAGLRDYTERLAGWQLKALREAKIATDWTAPNIEYEEAARSFLYSIMDDAAGFAAEAANFARRIGPAGAVNGLAQTMLKMTAPGVPDFYQGTEFWDQSLVDPDNRGAVDFRSRVDSLHDAQAPEALAACWRDGRVKQALIQRILAARRSVAELFSIGSYQPLEVSGPLAGHVVAFARSFGSERCVTIVPRLPARLLAGRDCIIIPAAVWQDTVVRPPEAALREWRDAVTGAMVKTRPGGIAVGDATARFPVALLTA